MLATDDTDSKCVEESLSKPEVFAVLFERHAVSLHRYLVKRIGQADAEDVVGETFVTAFRSRSSDTTSAEQMPGPGSSASPRTWFITTGVTVVAERGGRRGLPLTLIMWIRVRISSPDSSSRSSGSLWAADSGKSVFQSLTCCCWLQGQGSVMRMSPSRWGFRLARSGHVSSERESTFGNFLASRGNT